MSTGTRNVDHFSFVHALKEAVAASAAPTYVSLKGYDHISILVPFKNATGVTGSAITLNQAPAVAGTGVAAGRLLPCSSAWMTRCLSLSCRRP